MSSQFSKLGATRRACPRDTRPIHPFLLNFELGRGGG